MTDANLTLGRYDGERFAGGSMRLEAGAAEAARERPSAGADLRLVTEAVAEVSALADRQVSALEAVRARLGG